MTNHHPTTSAAHATTSQTNVNHASFDWTGLIAQAMHEGGQAFLKTISSADPNLDDVRLTQDENQVNRRLAQALDATRRARTNPGPHLLSAVRNWSRKQAFALLREKIEGKQVRSDFYQPFLFDLQQEISTMILDLQLFWEQEDEQQAALAQQQAAAKREEAEQAFGTAYPYIRGLSDAILNGERQRQAIFNDGQNAVQQWANAYEKSMRQREGELAEREKRLQQQEHENREHQIALRSLTKWDDRNSFANAVVNTGKNTIGCLFLWLLLVIGILVAVYFAFPHH